MGFNVYPALAIRQPDLGKTLITAAYLKSSKLKNQLAQAKLKRLKLVQGLGAQVMGGGDGVPDGAGEPGEQLPGAAGVSEGGASPMIDPASEAMRELMAIDPEVGGQYVTAIKKMNEETRKQKKEQNAKITRLLIEVEDTPEGLQRQQAYTQAREKARQMGFDIRNVPEQYEPRYVQQKIKFGMAIDDEIGAVERKARTDGVWEQYAGGRRFRRLDKLKEGEVIGNEPTKPPAGYRGADGNLESIPGGPADPKVVQALDKAKTQQYSGEVFLDDRVGKYYQVNPKTNKREYISPNEEFLIESTPGGGFRISKGSAKSTGLTTATTGNIEKKLLAANESYVRLQNMAATFKPEFQETGYRLEDLMTTWQAKLQGAKSVSKEDTKRHVEYVTHRRESFSFLNQYIKDITGAQMSEHEAKRIMKAAPNPGDTLLGGDDPIAYQAKMAGALMEASKAKARYEYYLKKGLSEGRDYDVDEMSKLTPLDSMRIAVEDKTGKRVVIFQGNAVPL